jgi:hypothetical protein
MIDLREAFGTQYNNFHNIPLLNNKFFSFRERGAVRCFDTEFFDDRIPGLERDELYKLSWTDMTADGSLLSINQLSARLNSNLSTASYKLLENSYKNARKKFSRPAKPSLNFVEYMLSKNKSSRPARKILSAAGSLVSARKSNCPLNNYALIADIPRPSSGIAKLVNSLWTVHFLSSDIKTFFFKAHHNILGLNSRVHHINNDRDPACTFCTKSKNFPAERETFQHFFWYCPTTHNVLNRFCRDYLREGFTMTREFFFWGAAPDRGRKIDNVPVLIICSLIRYVLWSFKLRKKLPSWPSFQSEFFYLFNAMLASSKKFKGSVQSCNIFKSHRED